MKIMIKGKDPFYNPGEYNEGGSTFVARKTGVKDGKVRHRYVYGKASKKWDPIPEGKTSFEIGNHGTGALIHITCTPTTGSTKVIGTLRNKDGEVLARISKEFNTGEAFTDEYRKWKPNKQRLITLVVKELQLHDRPIGTMRDIERSMQDIGLFPEELASVKNMHIVKSVQDQQIGMGALVKAGDTLESVGTRIKAIRDARGQEKGVRIAARGGAGPLPDSIGRNQQRMQHRQQMLDNPLTHPAMREHVERNLEQNIQQDKGGPGWDPSQPSIFQEIEGKLDKGFDTLLNSSEMMRLLTMEKSVPAIQTMRDFLDFGRVSDRTRRQLVRRSKNIFSLLNPKQQKKAIPYMFDITRHDYP